MANKAVVPLRNDGKSPTKLTQARIVEVAKGIAKGWSRLTALEKIQDMYGVSEAQAEKYYSSAIKWLVPDDPEFRQQILNKNVTRLETMIEQAQANGERKVANELIRTLNQMMGVGGNRVMIGEQDADGNQKVIEITFD